MVLEDSNSQSPSVEKEVRFAVVMYGGGSLAIYMNGVAQELYKLVQATATQNKDDSLEYFIKNPEGTQAVYRDLGKQLKARFVIDILSGTSAGGINAVYLAKALANAEDMAQLETLWIEQGNIERLIYDDQSTQGMDDLTLIRPPASLLNSERMYYQLLDAFNHMDQNPQRSEDGSSPFVDEMNLYVTATDIRGLLLPILLADGEKHEYRYRTVFRFNHSTLGAKEDWSLDFEQKNNPFLAFAARATSAFPFAFQPIKLGDTEIALKMKHFMQLYNYEELNPRWNKFFRDYNLETDDFRLHSFGDGGYLDNKPFSYITETLLRRRAEMPIDRKLFYVEPAPERLMDNPLPENDRPDALENVYAALISLPRYETIREDLLQIKVRNDLIERMNNILRQIERARGSLDDLSIWKSKKSDKSHKVPWISKYLHQLLSEYGVAYGTYHQLRVADTLDAFAAALSRNIGLEEESSSFSAMREIIEAWRNKKYSSNAGDSADHVSENDLLYRMDVNWHLRRLYFLLGTIDHLILGLRAFRTDLTDQEKAALFTEEQEQGKHAEELVQNSRRDKTTWQIDKNTESAYMEILSWVKHEFNSAYVELRNRIRKLRERNLALRQPQEDEPPNFADYIRALHVLPSYRDRLDKILKNADELAGRCNTIEGLSLTLSARPDGEENQPIGYLHETIRNAADACENALAFKERDHGSAQALSRFPAEVLDNIGACLKFYYEHFEYFDMLTFPIMYATPISESAVVDVYRISPEDAAGLMSEKQDKKTKLAGTKIGDFGSFFKEEWRHNDILWGQLDGAERIITTLLPDSDKRTQFLVRAWLAILKDKMSILGTDNLNALKDRFDKIPTLPNGWERFLDTQKFSPEELIELKPQLHDYFVNDYNINMKLSPEILSHLFGRAVLVTGELLNGLVKRYPRIDSLLIWTNRVSSAMQVVIPGTAKAQSWNYRIKVAYVLEGLLIVLGLLLRMNGAMPHLINSLFWVGIILLALTLIVHFTLKQIGKRILTWINSKI
jgi:patatin-related protein